MKIQLSATLIALILIGCNKEYKGVDETEARVHSGGFDKTAISNDVVVSTPIGYGRGGEIYATNSVAKYQKVEEVYHFDNTPTGFMYADRVYIDLNNNQYYEENEPPIINYSAPAGYQNINAVTSLLSSGYRITSDPDFGALVAFSPSYDFDAYEASKNSLEVRRAVAIATALFYFGEDDTAESSSELPNNSSSLASSNNSSSSVSNIADPGNIVYYVTMGQELCDIYGGSWSFNEYSGGGAEDGICVIEGYSASSFAMEAVEVFADFTILECNAFDGEWNASGDCRVTGVNAIASASSYVSSKNGGSSISQTILLGSVTVEQCSELNGVWSFAFNTCEVSAEVLDEYLKSLNEEDIVLLGSSSSDSNAEQERDNIQENDVQIPFPSALLKTLKSTKQYIQSIKECSNNVCIDSLILEMQFDALRSR